MLRCETETGRAGDGPYCGDHCSHSAASGNPHVRLRAHRLHLACKGHHQEAGVSSFLGLMQPDALIMLLPLAVAQTKPTHLMSISGMQKSLPRSRYGLLHCSLLVCKVITKKQGCSASHAHARQYAHCWRLACKHCYQEPMGLQCHCPCVAMWSLLMYHASVVVPRSSCI